MRRSGINRVPYTSAFGGVDTGKANPRLAASATSQIACDADIPNPSANDPAIGTINDAVAVLLVSSLSNTVTPASASISNMGCIDTPDIDRANEAAAPLVSNTLPRVNPPAMRKSVSQSND